MNMPATNDMQNIEINEITPLLKQLGLSGQDGPISSQKTRKVVVQEIDIRIDGNLPIILNSELFTMINEDLMKTSCPEENLEGEENGSYDPKIPLYEQFTTIKEFAPPQKHQKKLISWNSYSKSESTMSLQSITTTSEASSWLSTSVSDESSFSSNITSTTYSEGVQDSNDEMFQPLLKMKQTLYTPRQLYERKKLQ